MHQHSPGLQIYKKDTLVEICPKVKMFFDETQKTWGLDLVFLSFGAHVGKIYQYTLWKHSWHERRSKKKIFKQIAAAIILLIHLKKYAFVNSLASHGVYQESLAYLKEKY